MSRLDELRSIFEPLVKQTLKVVPDPANSQRMILDESDPNIVDMRLRVSREGLRLVISTSGFLDVAPPPSNPTTMTVCVGRDASGGLGIPKGPQIPVYRIQGIYFR